MQLPNMATHISCVNILRERNNVRRIVISLSKIRDREWSYTRVT